MKMKRKAMKQPQQEPQMSLGKEFGIHILGEVALYAANVDLIIPDPAVGVAGARLVRP